MTETANLVDVVETTDGGTILALDNSGAALLLIDPVTLATKKSLAVGTRPDEVVLSPDDTHAYVLDTSRAEALRRDRGDLEGERHARRVT